MTAYLRTPRLMLRAPVGTDGAGLSRAINHRRVLAETMSWAYPAGPAMCRHRLEAFARADRRSDATFLITNGREVFGLIGLHRRRRRVFGLGYMLGPAVWGHGYATEAGRAVLAHGFETLRADRIEADVFASNIASQRVLEKLGFVGPSETGAGWSATRRANFPRVAYALERKDWQA